MMLLAKQAGLQCVCYQPSLRQMQKAPPLNSRTYISQSSNIDSTEGCKYVRKYVQKSSKKSKRSKNGIRLMKRGR